MKNFLRTFKKYFDSNNIQNQKLIIDEDLIGSLPSVVETYSSHGKVFKIKWPIEFRRIEMALLCTSTVTLTGYFLLKDSDVNLFKALDKIFYEIPEDPSMVIFIIFPIIALISIYLAFAQYFNSIQVLIINGTITSSIVPYGSLHKKMISRIGNIKSLNVREYVAYSIKEKTITKFSITYLDYQGCEHTLSKYIPKKEQAIRIKQQLHSILRLE